jgi:superkiller protein 3
VSLHSKAPPGRLLVVAFALAFPAEFCHSQMSGFSPDEHLSSQTHLKNQQELLFDVISARQLLDAHPSAEASLALGRALKGLGETQTASAFFDRALELNPQLAEGWFEKGLILSEEGDWSKAADLFRRSLAISSNFSGAHLALGEMLLRTGEFEAASKELKTVVQLDSNSAGAHEGLGLIYLQQGRLDDAAEEFKHALSLRPGYVDAQKGLARVLASQHKWNEAVSLLKRVVAVKPNSSEDAFALGTALANAGDKLGATEQFARARELSNHLLTLLRAKGDGNLGISLRNEGKLQEAADAFRRAITDDPTFCEAHDDLGEVLWMQKDMAGALPEFQSAVRCDPNSAMALNNLGSALLYSNHDLQAAIEQFRSALALKPGFALAHLNLGKALAAKQDFATAEPELRSAIAIDPNLAAAHLNLGLVIAGREGKLTSEAQAEIQKAVRLDPRLREMIPQHYVADLK